MPTKKRPSKKTASKSAKGRPKIDDDKKRKKVGFSLSPEVTSAIHLMAEHHGTSISAIAEDALTKAIGLYYLGKDKPQ